VPRKSEILKGKRFSERLPGDDGATAACRLNKACIPDMKPGSHPQKSGQDASMKRLQAVLEHLPGDVEYTFIRMILAALPPAQETAVWTNPQATHEILTVSKFSL
jgi:hypothetical protein